MGTPDNKSQNRVHGARMEILSAMSALNMAPEPITPEHPAQFYLSQTDGMAKHAMEHLRAAFDYIRDVSTYPTGDFSKTLADKITAELIEHELITQTQKAKFATVIRFLLEDINR